MRLSNIEGYEDWNIRPDWARDREPGISAFVRVRHEAEWIEKSLSSIDWCDEIVIAIHGEQEDGTDDIIRGWAEGRSHVRVMEYPFLSRPNGPGHDQQPKGSVHESAYFYNWTLSRTTRSHALKWDGDMVAFDWLEDRLRERCAAWGSVYFAGVDIAATEPLRVSLTHPLAASEPRLFRVSSSTYYETGLMTQTLRVPEPRFRIDEPGYLHFKWAKSPESQRSARPGTPASSMRLSRH